MRSKRNNVTVNLVQPNPLVTRERKYPDIRLRNTKSGSILMVKKKNRDLWQILTEDPINWKSRIQTDLGWKTEFSQPIFYASDSAERGVGGWGRVDNRTSIFCCAQYILLDAKRIWNTNIIGLFSSADSSGAGIQKGPWKQVSLTYHLHMSVDKDESAPGEVAQMVGQVDEGRVVEGGICFLHTGIC